MTATPSKRAATHSPPRKVVLTGGPAAGKTAVSEVLMRQLGDRIAIVPESATLLFRGGFPRPRSVPGRRLVQKAVFSTQRHLEEVFLLTHPDVHHVLDRGSLDGGAYWPGGLQRFLGAMGTTLESEYRRCDAVIFMESAANGEGGYPDENPIRIETPSQARRLDAALRAIWGGHPNFTLINCQRQFTDKVAAVLEALELALGLRKGALRAGEPGRRRGPSGS